MLRIVFGTSFRRLNRNQREKLSEVKSPLPRLTKVNNRIQKDLFRHRPNTYSCLCSIKQMHFLRRLFVQETKVLFDRPYKKHDVC